jgi:hypothetical protein
MKLPWGSGSMWGMDKGVLMSAMVSVTRCPSGQFMTEGE